MNEKSQRTSHEVKTQRSIAPKAILIVEDENLLAWDIEQTLRDHDFQEIMVTWSVRGARELMQTLRTQISLVILDLKLEDGDASVLIDEFYSRGIAVLVTTGYNGFKHGHLPVLYKPFTANTMLQAVKSLLPIHS